VRGRVTLRRSLSRRMARARTGEVTLTYVGDAGTATERVALRAGRRSARLRAARPMLDSGRLRARGSLARRARGQVRLRVSFLAGGTYRTHSTQARIVRGRYSASAPLPAALRAWLARRDGAVRVTTTYAGRAGRSVHGEQRVATATVR